MARFRSPLWLIALFAFVLPSFGIPMAKAQAHVMAPAAQTAPAEHKAPAHHAAPAEQTASSMDCPDHAPPPDCPAKGSAKHAAGTCCPLMAGVVAVLSSVMIADPLPLPHVRVLAGGQSLTGLLSTQDPPPPRV